MFWKAIKMEPSIFGLIFRKQTFSKMNQGKVVMKNCFLFKRTRWKLTALSLMVFQSTGKSLLETLSFASTNPQYDNRLFIDCSVHENYKLRKCCVHKLFWMSKQKQKNKQFVCTTCSPHVLSLQFSCIELVDQWTICCHIVG